MLVSETPRTAGPGERPSIGYLGAKQCLAGRYHATTHPRRGGGKAEPIIGLPPSP